MFLWRSLISRCSETNLYLKVREQLTPGATIRNYKELCLALDLPVTGGCAKKSQLAILNRFCSFERMGQKYIITEVFETPREKETKQKPGNKSIYVSYIERLLLGYFSRHEMTTYNFTKRQLWELLGMVNSNYAVNYKSKRLLSRMQMLDNRVKQWHIDEFYRLSRKKLTDIINSALNSLQNRKLIVFSDNVLMAKKNGTYYEVTDEFEIERISEIEYESMIELGCNNMREVMFNSNREVNYEAYLDLRNTKLRMELGIDYVYRRYRVICNRECFDQAIQEDDAGLKRILNGKVIDAVNQSVKKSFEKNRADVRDGKSSFRYPDWYMEIQSLLAAMLLEIAEPELPESINMLENIAEIDELFSA